MRRLNQRGRTVAFAIENLQLTYDMVDGVTNPSNVRMVAADLTAAGACAPQPVLAEPDSQGQRLRRRALDASGSRRRGSSSATR